MSYFCACSVFFFSRTYSWEFLYQQNGRIRSWRLCYSSLFHSLKEIPTEIINQHFPITHFDIETFLVYEPPKGTFGLVNSSPIDSFRLEEPHTTHETTFAGRTRHYPFHSVSVRPSKVTYLTEERTRTSSLTRRCWSFQGSLEETTRYCQCSQNFQFANKIYAKCLTGSRWGNGWLRGINTYYRLLYYIETWYLRV